MTRFAVKINRSDKNHHERYISVNPSESNMRNAEGASPSPTNFDSSFMFCSGATCCSRTVPTTEVSEITVKTTTASFIDENKLQILSTKPLFSLLPLTLDNFPP